jgi:peptidoglycan/xylan/chitin deacetylase (PgdA/CDA1 family)
MPPQPPDETAPRSRSRYATDSDARTFSSGAPDRTSSGRHRRPESLADQTQLRPAPALPSQNRRSAEDRFELGDFEESFIERGFPELTRVERRRAESGRTGETPLIGGGHSGEMPLVRGETSWVRPDHTGETPQIPVGHTGETPQVGAGRSSRKSRAWGRRHTGETPQIPVGGTGPVREPRGSHRGETSPARASQTGEIPQARGRHTGEMPHIRAGETPRIPAGRTGETPLLRDSYTGETPQVGGRHTGELPQVPAGPTGAAQRIPGGRTGETPQVRGRYTGAMPQIAASPTGETPGIRGSRTGQTPQVRGRHTGELPQIPATRTGETPPVRGRHTGELPQIPAGRTGETPRVGGHPGETPPVDGSRAAEALYADAARAAQARRIESGPSAEQRWGRRAQARRRAEERRADRMPVRDQQDADTEPRGNVSPRLPGSGGRGKHAAPPRPVVTVRQLPAVRDAVVDGLPAAKRAADAVREWALYTGDSPPATGTHRAPGTLPIESWLLIGRGRQQALLATLVAAGLALVMIPIQHGNVNPVNAANRSIVGTSAGQKAKTKSPGSKPAGQTGTPGKPAAQSTTPGQSTAPKTLPATGGSAGVEPAIAVPPGTGPAQSLRVTGSRTVALTFDDGPDPVQTPKILAMLDQYQIKATFCLVGRQVQKHPEIVRQIVAAGHTLCNHTWNHSLTIGTEKPAQIRADLQKTSAAIRAAAPGAKIPFFRAPGGNFTDRLVSVAYGEQMTSLYWQVDPRDWDHSTDADDAAHIDRVIAAVEKDVKPGSIILSHDFGQPDTIAAYEKLLPWLTERFEIGLPVPPPVPSDPASPPASPPSGEPPEAQTPEAQMSGAQTAEAQTSGAQPRAAQPPGSEAASGPQ